jgi:hypothetical protein
MTPKEKAAVLVNQMYEVFNMDKYPDVLIDETDNELNDKLWDKNRELFESIYKKFAKQSALIAVDELIYFGDTELLSSLIFDGNQYCDRDFFIDVKKEIEAL